MTLMMGTKFIIKDIIDVDVDCRSTYTGEREYIENITVIQKRDMNGYNNN